ncbi:hypothetical protein ES703_64232 [subsurface metagenome]
MDDTNQKILEKLNKIQIDIEFIRENIKEDEELSEWAEKELDEARKVPDSEMVSFEEAEQRILRK